MTRLQHSFSVATWVQCGLCMAAVGLLAESQPASLEARSFRAQLEAGEFLMEDDPRGAVEHYESLLETAHEREDPMRKLRETQSEVIRMEKDATLGVLTAGAAHEINNPMNVIRGALYGIEDALDAGSALDPEDLRGLTRQIQAGVERTTMIVKGLYAFSRQPTTPTLQELDLAIVLKECVARFQHARAGQVEFLQGRERTDCKVLGDTTAIEQVVTNLLSNACDAVDDGGRVRVGLELTTGEGGDLVRLTVEDDGVGIDPEHLDRIYDPFFTSKPPGKSIGIGLTFVYRLVTDLGGSIRHCPSAGGGVRVTVDFPRHS